MTNDSMCPCQQGRHRRIEPFNARVEKVRPQMVNIAGRTFSNRDDAEDCVQDAVIRAWQRDPDNREARCPMYDPTRLPFYNWMRMLVVHVCYDRLRRVQSKPAPLSIEAGIRIYTGDVIIPERVSLPLEDEIIPKLFVDDLLSRCSPFAAECVAMSMIGMSITEVSRALGAGNKTVSMTLKSLQPCLAGET